MSLSALLERVEACRGPDRELDAAICETLHSSVCEPEHRGTHRGEPVWRHPDFGLIRCEPYTASVDAALALIGRVLPGWIVCALDEWEDDVLRAKGPWMAVLKERGVRLTAPNPSRCQHAPTPALALCAALLAAMIGEEAKP